MRFVAGALRLPRAGTLERDAGLYTSRARILLSGVGADEQLGGYSRHGTAFRQGGWPGLAQELRSNIRRIADRNLGVLNGAVHFLFYVVVPASSACPNSQHRMRACACHVGGPTDDGHSLAGRDDRCASDHGKEVRHPYLDEAVVDLLSSYAACLKTHPAGGRDVGDKVLLRQVAWRLGLRNTARQPKRAIQFGSRIAKLAGPSGPEPPLSAS